jgi:pimeloyl-ACP methyl ester carboxylesterase
MIGWIVLAVIGAGLLLGMLRLARFLLRRARRQREIAASLAIRTPNGIESGIFVRLGGIEQWISIRGEDRRNPVVLVLHGGPATSYMGWAPLFQSWERHFTVVQWDRRGVGKTFGRNGGRGCGEMTLDRIVADGAELARFLAEHLQQDRIILLGHSMGSMIGITLASRHPQLFRAYIGTEQLLDMARNEAVSYQIILQRLREQGDFQRARKLEALGPPPYSTARRWGVKQFAAEAADKAYGSLSKRIDTMTVDSPAYTLKDHLDLIFGAGFCLGKLFAQWMTFDAHRLGTRFGIPIYIITGSSDVMAPTQLSEEWLRSIEAPGKALITIPNAGHLVFATAPEVYLNALIGLVTRPTEAPVGS